MAPKLNAVREAALAAAEARLKGPSTSQATNDASSSGSGPGLMTQPSTSRPSWTKPSEKQDLETRRNFARLLDRGIVRDNGYKQSAEAVETLIKICMNILENPDEVKYRDIRATNSLLQNKVLEVKGGHEYLIALGFRIVTREFVKHYVLQTSLARMHELEIGAEVLKTHLANLQARAASEAASKVNHQSAESARKARALAEYEEDRDAVKNRAERERLNRLYREQAAREKAEQEAEREEEEREREEEMDLQAQEVNEDSTGPGGSTATGLTSGEAETDHLVHDNPDDTMDDDEEAEHGTYSAFPAGGKRLGE
ncbi:hypothetical protein BD324DRAFT_577259 [Kockovaella imperatae]|uniref:PUB domain-containing protein n=1 Tax=Kockovaella imperatae TaxID=4999 RepID=A0A1Y1UP15_9TREE|nr:hypothetical protein BD324DRAFT_577259 [Kockovaella imperatae]ORX38855.1 hypothetical protein BD324DRAFT_577259 [Kockovaella imperatae]